MWCLSKTNPEPPNSLMLAASSISGGHSLIDRWWVDPDGTSRRKETFHEFYFDACGQGSNSNLSASFLFWSTFITNSSSVAWSSRSRFNMLPCVAFCGSRCLYWKINSFSWRKGLRIIFSWWRCRNRWTVHSVSPTLFSSCFAPVLFRKFFSFSRNHRLALPATVYFWRVAASSCAQITACLSLPEVSWKLSIRDVIMSSQQETGLWVAPPGIPSFVSFAFVWSCRSCEDLRSLTMCDWYSECIWLLTNSFSRRRTYVLVTHDFSDHLQLLVLRTQSFVPLPSFHFLPLVLHIDTGHSEFLASSELRNSRKIPTQPDSRHLLPVFDILRLLLGNVVSEKYKTVTCVFFHGFALAARPFLRNSFASC